MVLAMSSPSVQVSNQPERRTTERAQIRTRATIDPACHMVDLPNVPMPQKVKVCSNSADAYACNKVTADPTA